MLVLSRKKSEQVIITVPPSAETRTVSMMVVEIRGDKVRVGFDADRDITINRKEVADAIERERSAQEESDG